MLFAILKFTILRNKKAQPTISVPKANVFFRSFFSITILHNCKLSTVKYVNKQNRHKLR